MKKLSLDRIKYFPAIPFTIALCFGIIISNVSPFPLWFSIPLFVISTTLFFLLKFRNLEKFVLMFALLSGFGFGIAAIKISNDSLMLNPFNTPRKSGMEVTARIIEVREMSRDNFIFTGEVTTASFDSSFVNEKGKKTRKRVSHAYNPAPKLIFKIRDAEPAVFSYVKQNIKPGRSIRLFGTFNLPQGKRNPGGFDYAAYLKHEMISGTFYVYSDSLIKISGEKDFISGNIFDLRKNIAEMLDSLHDPETAAILKGLIIADRSEIDEETVNSYIDTGIAHILAVSGFNVGIIYLLTLLLFQKIKPHSRWFDIIARLTILFLFLMLTQFQVTVLRAVIMFSVHSLLKFSGRLTNRWNTLAIAVFIILLFNPQDLFSTSFQLSAAAVASLFIAESIYSSFRFTITSFFNSKKAEIKRKASSFFDSFVFRNLSELVVVTFFVQLGMLPFLLIYFGKITLLSLPANIVAVPVSSLMLLNGLLTLFVSVFSTSAAALLASASGLLNKILNITIVALKDTNWGKIELQNFSLADGIVFYLLIFSLILIYSRKRDLKWRLSSAVFALLIMVITHSAFKATELSKNASYIVAIDTGQGDCYLLKDKSGGTVLIDAGVLSERYDAGKSTVLPTLKRLGVDSIDIAFISHYDIDHAGGMVTLSRQGVIKRLFVPPPDSSDISDLSLFALFSTFITPTVFKEGEVLKTEEFTIKSLIHTDSLDVNTESNRRSMVLSISVNNLKMLFTGDLDRVGERKLIRNNINLDSDLLKVSHHGSNSATTNLFLNAVKPKVAIISAGVANRYNLPHPLVIERLEDSGCSILRTDIEGCIILEIDDDKHLQKIDWR